MNFSFTHASRECIYTVNSIIVIINIIMNKISEHYECACSKSIWLNHSKIQKIFDGSLSNESIEAFCKRLGFLLNEISSN